MYCGHICTRTVVSRQRGRIIEEATFRSLCALTLRTRPASGSLERSVTAERQKYEGRRFGHVFFCIREHMVFPIIFRGYRHDLLTDANLPCDTERWQTLQSK